MQPCFLSMQQLESEDIKHLRQGSSHERTSLVERQCICYNIIPLGYEKKTLVKAVTPGDLLACGLVSKKCDALTPGMFHTVDLKVEMKNDITFDFNKSWMTVPTAIRT